MNVGILLIEQGQNGIRDLRAAAGVDHKIAIGGGGAAGGRIRVGSGSFVGLGTAAGGQRQGKDQCKRGAEQSFHVISSK